MSSPAVASVQAGSEDADLFMAEIGVLATPVEWMRYCSECDGEHRFYAATFCEAGLVAGCTNCGHLAIAPFTRTTTEVA